MNQPDISRRNVAASVCARLHAVAAIANLFSLHRGRECPGDRQCCRNGGNVGGASAG